MTDQLVKDAMTTPMLTLAPETPVTEAADGMLQADIKSVIIVGDACQPKGIFTSTDALRALAVADTDATISDYMTAPVDTISVTAPLTAAAELMDTGSFSHLPVIDEDGNGQGVLTTTDLAEALPEAGRELLE